MDPFGVSAPWYGTLPPAILDEIGRTAGFLTAQGWTAGEDDQLSVLLPPAPGAEQGSTGETQAPLTANRELLITQAGCRLRDLAAFPPGGLSLIQLDAEGRPGTTAGGVAPESLATHLAIHSGSLARRGGEGALLFAHPPALLTLVSLGVANAAAEALGILPSPQHAPSELAGILAGLCPQATAKPAAKLQVVDLAGLRGSEVVQACATALRTAQLLLVPRSGLYSRGRTLAEALDYAEAAERAAAMVLRLRPIARPAAAAAADRTGPGGSKEKGKGPVMS